MTYNVHEPILSESNFVLRFDNNGNNSCFGNVVIQSFLACGDTFFKEVFSI